MERYNRRMYRWKEQINTTHRRRKMRRFRKFVRKIRVLTNICVVGEALLVLEKCPECPNE